MHLTIKLFKMGLHNPAVNTCFGGMYRSFFRSLTNAGHTVSLVSAMPDNSADLLIAPMGGSQDQDCAKAMSRFNGPVILYVPPASAWFRLDFLKRWHNRILFAYGTDSSGFSPAAYRKLGITYHHIPFASDPEIMRPLQLPRIYDVLFVGNAESGTGRDRYIDKLLTKTADKHVLLLGSGWERYGFPRQLLAWGELLNLLYNCAHICINLANNEQNQEDKRLDANNRLFDLAMAGCFQVSNAPAVVQRYFDASQVVTAPSPEEWLDKIEYFLAHPEETAPYREAAHKKALLHHCWHHRAVEFLQHILPILQHMPQKISLALH